MPIYRAFNAPMQTTAAIAKVTTGTAIKTMLQIATPATRSITLIGWGFTLDVAPGAASIVELLQTDVAATVTAHGATGVQPQNAADPASLMTLGTSATGFTGTAEGSTTATRTFDVKLIPLTAGTTDLTYEKVFVPGARPVVPVSKFLRVRTTFATSASNMLTWVDWLE